MGKTFIASQYCKEIHESIVAPVTIFDRFPYHKVDSN
jgi:hypothetical protein